MLRWLRKLNTRLGLDSRPRLRKFLVGFVGISVLLVGILMVVLPGPAVIIIPIGFAILATEFAWAGRVWRRGKLVVERVRESAPVKKVARTFSRRR